MSDRRMNTTWPAGPKFVGTRRQNTVSAWSDLEFHFEVSQFLLAYCACIDEDRLEEWPAFFNANGLYEMATRENVDRAIEMIAKLDELEDVSEVVRVLTPA